MPADSSKTKRALGVCSWSLLVESPQEVASRARASGARAVQLALDPLRRSGTSPEEARRRLEGAGVRILSGMMAMAGEDYSSLESIRRTGGVRPDDTWPENLRAACADAYIARRLGVTLVTFHAGFLPEERRDPERERILARLRELCRVFGREGIRIGLETGQERAATLLEVLEDLDEPGLGVNFDPANMILYGMGDPVDALEALAPHVLQIHVKDALPPERPGEWGREVPAGEGAVDWQRFFRVLEARGIDCDLVVEREAGEDRIGDVRRALALVREHLGVEA